MIWWLSFCDPKKPKGERFLGACLVEADGFLAAVSEANRQGCNPHGEVAGRPAPPEFENKISDKWMNRLLTRAECEAFDAEQDVGLIEHGPILMPEEQLN